MDSTFARAWEKGETPFDGVTVFQPELVWLAALRPTLVALIDHLQRLCPQTPLCCGDDWHDHDGFVSEASAFSWEQLRDYLISEETLKEADRGDFAVRLGIFPAERKWYLRILVTSDSFGVGCPEDCPDHIGGLPHFGTWDLTGSESLVTAVEQGLTKQGFKVSRMPAKQFFDERNGSNSVFLPGDPIPPEILRSMKFPTE